MTEAPEPITTDDQCPTTPHVAAAPMTFAQCLEALSAILPGMICLEVNCWRPRTTGDLRWQVWVSDWSMHVTEPTPERLIARVKHELSVRSLPLSQPIETVGTIEVTK